MTMPNFLTKNIGGPQQLLWMTNPFVKSFLFFIFQGKEIKMKCPRCKIFYKTTDRPHLYFCKCQEFVYLSDIFPLV